MPIDEISEAMANSDLGIVPKRKDSFGNEAFSTKIFEFMSVGVPVLVSDTKIDKFYFNDDIVQFFTSGDEHDLADKLLKLIKDEDLRKRLVKNATTFIKENSWEVHKQKYLELVDGLVV